MTVFFRILARETRFRWPVCIFIEIVSGVHGGNQAFSIIGGMSVHRDEVYFEIFKMKIVENSRWIEEQFADCHLGDKRRTERLQRVAENMLASPEQSLPKQNPLWADLKAAYRLFDRPEVSYEAVAKPHWEKTKREATGGTFLLISDTTDIDHFNHRATEGLGMLGSGVGRGLQQHSCLTFDCARGQIVGQAGGILYKRKRTPKNETRKQRLERYRESSLWGELVDQVGAPSPDARWVHVFDRGGDNFEAMCHIKANRCEFVIRAAKLNRTVVDPRGNEVSLQEAVEDAELVGTYELSLRARRGVKARTAKIEVSTCRVTLTAPRICSSWVKNSAIKEISVNVVVVSEVNAPQGVKPIKWVLLTTLPASTFSAAWEIIEYYEHRWLIEEYHKVIKTGCSVERHSLRTSDRLEPLIGLIGVIGIRLLQLKLVGRNQPTARAKTHVPATWLKALKLARPKVRLTEMTVYEFFRELAKMGGFLGRKSDGEPGWETTWHGFQKLKSILDAMRLTGQI